MPEPEVRNESSGNGGRATGLLRLAETIAGTITAPGRRARARWSSRPNR